MKRKINKAPQFNFIIAPDFTEKELQKIGKLAEKGNIHAKINIMMHNQFIINYKLQSK